jgi:hypothetical protein
VNVKVGTACPTVYATPSATYEVLRRNIVRHSVTVAGEVAQTAVGTLKNTSTIVRGVLTARFDNVVNG